MFYLIFWIAIEFCSLYFFMKCIGCLDKKLFLIAKLEKGMGTYILIFYSFV